MAGVLFVLGGARCVWDDFSRAMALHGSAGFDVMAVNDIGMHYPGILRHWYSNDAKMLRAWSACRRYYRDAQCTLHTNDGAGTGRVDGMQVWDVSGGNSAINAVRVGIGLGYGKIVVCGVPLDDSGWYFSPPWEDSSYGNEYVLDEWRSRSIEFDGVVFSMSGRTMEVLGDGAAFDRIL